MTHVRIARRYQQLKSILVSTLFRGFFSYVLFPALGTLDAGLSFSSPCASIASLLNLLCLPIPDIGKAVFPIAKPSDFQERDFKKKEESVWGPRGQRPNWDFHDPTPKGVPIK